MLLSSVEAAVMPAPKKHPNRDKAHTVLIYKHPRTVALVDAYGAALEKRWRDEMRRAEFEETVEFILAPMRDYGGSVERNSVRYQTTAIYRYAIADWDVALQSGELVDLELLDKAFVEYLAIIHVAVRRGTAYKQRLEMQPDEYEAVLRVYRHLLKAGVIGIKSPRREGVPKGTIIMFYALYRAAWKHGRPNLPRLI